MRVNSSFHRLQSLNALLVSPAPHLLDTNDVPTLEESRAIRAIIAEKRQALDKVKEDMERLRIEEESMQDFLSKHEAILSPARRMPRDIVAEIFTHVGREPLGPLSKSAPLTLGWICSGWRSIAITTPCLWSSIPVYSSLLGLVTPSLYREWLTRSGKLPLKIHVRGYNAEHNWMPVLQALLDHTDRWREVHLELPSKVWEFTIWESAPKCGLPMLRTLHTNSPMLQSWLFLLSPVLRCLNLQYTRPPQQAPQFGLLFTQQLTKLVITGCSFAQCYAIMRDARNLVHLQIAIVNTPESTTPIQLDPIHLPLLHSFAVMLGSDHSLITSLIAPVLRTLKIVSSGSADPLSSSLLLLPSPFDSLQLFLSRSSSLQSLSLDHFDILEPDLIEALLHNAPMLKRLELTGLPLLTTSTLQRMTPGSPAEDTPMLPDLERLCLQDMHLNELSLLNMLNSRRNPRESPKLARLQSVLLGRNNGFNPWTSKFKYDVRAMKEQGLIAQLAERQS